MRRMLAVVAVVVAVLTGPAPSWAHHRSPGREAGLAIGAAAIDAFYTPAKLMTAVIGLAVGGMVGVLTGGSTRAAYAIWVPTATGTFVLTSAHMEGEERVQFFGCDYADRASTMSNGEAGSVYEAAYTSR